MLFRHIPFHRRSDNGVHQSYKKCTKNCAASVHQHSLDGCVDFLMGAELGTYTTNGVGDAISVGSLGC
ncbi:zinc finger BED domain-containing protein RICESLEEPER 2 [Tanacetum coccineum]